jgi:hypothetical protein
VEKSVDQDVHQNRVGIVTLKEFEFIMTEIYLPLTTLRAWAASGVTEVLNREEAAGTVAGVNSRVVLVHSFANCIPSMEELDQKGAIWNWD